MGGLPHPHRPGRARSLHACLPAELWRAFLATSGPGGDFGFLTAQLAELVVVEESINYPAAADPAEGHYAVDRRTLRRLLLAGLDDVVTFGAELVRYEHTADGRVAAVFADGTCAVGDVLVGADGIGSRVRRQYLPDAEPEPVGVGGIAQKVWLTDGTRAWVPRRLQHGMNLVLDDGAATLFTSAYEPPPGTRAALERVTSDVPAGIETPYVLCALVADPARLPADLLALDGPALRALVAGLVADWHPDLRRMLVDADPESRGAHLFSASPAVPAWPSSRVTVLGDAIHAMPATGGLGGNAALRDARLLTDRLAAVARGEQDLLTAIGVYEAAMREHGRAAVRATCAPATRCSPATRSPPAPDGSGCACAASPPRCAAGRSGSPRTTRPHPSAGNARPDLWTTRADAPLSVGPPRYCGSSGDPSPGQCPGSAHEREQPARRTGPHRRPVQHPPPRRPTPAPVPPRTPSRPRRRPRTTPGSAASGRGRACASSRSRCRPVPAAPAPPRPSRRRPRPTRCRRSRRSAGRPPARRPRTPPSSPRRPGAPRPTAAPPPAPRRTVRVELHEPPRASAPRGCDASTGSTSRPAPAQSASNRTGPRRRAVEREPDLLLYSCEPLREPVLRVVVAAVPVEPVGGHDPSLSHRCLPRGCPRRC
ncbi:hypothetical protein BJF78_30800 [Pseudonocardia sp. CNS-139]|nr:hypothetical protein BJF78_30800 [Pseudonocardia sp. CNS-139]